MFQAEGERKLCGKVSCVVRECCAAWLNGIPCSSSVDMYGIGLFYGKIGFVIMWARYGMLCGPVGEL